MNTVTPIITPEQRAIWTDRGRVGARGDLAAASTGQPLASGPIRDLVEAWLLQDGPTERGLAAMDPLAREAAIEAAMGGYCEVMANVDSGLSEAMATLERCWGPPSNEADAAGLEAARDRLKTLWKYEELRDDAVSSAISRGLRVRTFWPEPAPLPATVER